MQLIAQVMQFLAVGFLFSRGLAKVVPFCSEFFSVVPFLSCLFAPEVGLYSCTPEPMLLMQCNIHNIQ